MLCNGIYTKHRIVESFEAIAISLAQQENFTELTVANENITVRIENVSNVLKKKTFTYSLLIFQVDLNAVATGRSIAASEGNGMAIQCAIMYCRRNIST